jgi:hypothetical protein
VLTSLDLFSFTSSHTPIHSGIHPLNLSVSANSNQNLSSPLMRRAAFKWEHLDSRDLQPSLPLIQLTSFLAHSRVFVIAPSMRRLPDFATSVRFSPYTLVCL